MFWSSILRLMPPQLYERVDKWTNPGPILIIRNTFPQFYSHFYFQHHFIPKIQKTYLLSCMHIQNPKIPFSHHIYFIALLFTLLHHIFILFTFTPCAWQTLGGVGGTRQVNYFIGCLNKNDERFFEFSSRIRYKPWVSSWEKLTLATTLCTWSPNELAPCLVSSGTHH
jgi:hypothetical protein